MPNPNSIDEVSGHLYDVFISFSSINIEIARFICDQLEAQGITCWLADRNRHDIPPGENWADQLMKGLENSKMVLLIFSKESNLSRHVQNEIGIAFDSKLDILPMRIQEEKPKGVLRYYLVHTQWFDIIPPPPPMEKGKLEKLMEVVRHLINETPPSVEHVQDHAPQNIKVPFFSTWVLKSSFSWIQNFFNSFPALDGALLTYVLMVLVFFVPLAISHRIVGDYPPQSLSELFGVATSSHYYYPDLNSILFDMVLHPAAFATLAYFVLFLNARGNQYLYSAAAGFIATNNERLTRFWINMANLLIVKILPVVMALVTFFYRRNVYIGYGMKEPLVFWASFAVGLSIYAYVALAINASYIALLLSPIPDTAMRGEDDRQFSSEWAGMLAKLTILFIYIILMILVEISDEWIMANFNYTPLTDLMRWIVIVFGGISVLILTARILWLFIPEIGIHSKSVERAFTQVNKASLPLLIVPLVLIILTIRLWLLTH